MDEIDAFKMMLEGVITRGAKLSSRTGNFVACQECIIHNGTECVARALSKGISRGCLLTIGNKMLIMGDDKPVEDRKAIREWVVNDLASMISVHS